MLAWVTEKSIDLCRSEDISPLEMKSLLAKSAYNMQVYINDFGIDEILSSNRDIDQDYLSPIEKELDLLSIAVAILIKGIDKLEYCRWSAMQAEGMHSTLAFMSEKFRLNED